MQIVRYPSPDTWPDLLKRPDEFSESLREKVSVILADVKRRGDDALRKYTRQYDGVELSDFRVLWEEIENSSQYVAEDLKAAIRLAQNNITAFHRTQRQRTRKIETSPGVFCWRKSVPIENVGLYIPGGTAPLFSSLLMLAIPARIVGCPRIIVCTPPQKNGHINPVILYIAQLLGLSDIFKLGGAQAIGALAYGTATVPAVDKIFGPGNRFVTIAKQLVTIDGAAIDMPAGPSEVAVIADDRANPDFVAADLLSQAEHGADSQVILITTSAEMITKVVKATQAQLAELPRHKIASQSLQNSLAILVNNEADAMDLVNFYAPEHLIIMTENSPRLANKVINAGSVFLGQYTPEAVGDYASGTNHTLPTQGYARSYSGVALDSFTRKITFQSLSAAGLNHIGPAVTRLAEEEGLGGHRKAVEIRLNTIREK